MSSGIFNKFTGYHNRKSMRLRDYDYSRPGYYFITVCIKDRRQNLFGNVTGGTMVLNSHGKIVLNEWHKTAAIRPDVALHEFMVMPNHIHGIINLRRGTACRAPAKQDDYIDVPGTARRAPTPTIEQYGKPTVGTIPTIIRAFKSAVSKRIHDISPGFQWQRNFYDHIIRDEKSLYFIRRYIQENPVNWLKDSENHIDHEIEQFNMKEIGKTADAKMRPCAEAQAARTFV